MRAADVTGLGPAEAIRVGELPRPAAGPTDVLARVEVVVVNPVDTLVRSGAFPTPTPFPFVVGRDLVGTVAVACSTRPPPPTWPCTATAACGPPRRSTLPAPPATSAPP